MESTEFIPNEHFNKWYELFKQSGGRLLCNPVFGRTVYVRYTFDEMDDYVEFQKNYQRLTTDIVKTRRGFWKRVAKRLGL